MSKIEDGGPAFPNVDSDERVGVYVGDRGMTLRDFFASCVIQLYLTSDDQKSAAQRAYMAADAMIVARKLPFAQ